MRIRLECPKCRAYLITYDFKDEETRPKRCQYCGLTYSYNGSKKCWKITKLDKNITSGGRRFN